MHFKGKVVWITGASSGIGEALAYVFAKDGARLILSARREKELQRVKANCPSDPASIFCLPLDLVDFNGLKEKTLEAVAKMGPIDILINNGGISQRSSVVETSMEVNKRIMDVNYFGAVALTKCILPQMIENKQGHIVVISSVVGKIGTPFRTAYSASKHALHGFFDGLRAELNPFGVKVTLVCPGYVQTNVSVNALRGDGTKHQEMDDKTAAGITAEECARKTLQAIKKEKLEVYIGGKEIYGVYIKRFFPRLAAWILTKIKLT